MPFPVSDHGFIKVPLQRPPDMERIVNAVTAALAGASASEISREGQEVTFHAGIFRFVGSWNPLVAITAGTIRLSSAGNHVCVDYLITFTQILVMVTAQVAILSIAVFREWNVTHWPVIIGIWLFLFGGNYLVAIFRFPRFLRRAIEASQAI